MILIFKLLYLAVGLLPHLTHGLPVEQKSLETNASTNPMFESELAAQLTPLEAHVLRIIKARSRTEKQISKTLQIDLLVLSPVVTDLMLKGCLETFRRRRFYFFTREFCCITPDGVLALEKSRTPIQNLVELLRTKALDAVDTVVAGSPMLKAVVFSAKAFYRVAKAAA